MTTTDIEDIYNLSPMQRGMLFHTLYTPHSGVYIDQTIHKLVGHVHVDLLHQAWQRIVMQHPTLRTAFIWEDLDNPLQVVYHSVPVSWQEHDWHELTPTQGHNKLEELLTTARQKGFDLAQPPLMHIDVIQFADEIDAVSTPIYYLVWTVHHIFLDGWSSAIVFQEVLQTYKRLCAGQEPRLSVRRPFRDYITWLHQRELTEAEMFWRQYLRGVTAPTPLLIDIPDWQDASVQSTEHQPIFHGGRPVQLCGLTLSPERCDELRLFARQHQLTLNTLIQGAWAILLHRYNGEQDILFGATVAGRPSDLTGSDNMVGLFINTLPVRVKVSSDMTLVHWLAQFQQQQAEARQYEYSSLVQIHGWSEISREQPLFESLIVFENYPVESENDEPTNDGLKVYGVQGLAQTNYPLVLIVSWISTGLSIQLGYETARFSSPAMERMLAHLETLLVEMLHHGEARLAELSLLDQEQRRRLLYEWNHAQEPIGISAPSLISAFRQQATQFAERIALVCGDEQLTYAELDRRSTGLAHCLQKIGVQPEICVGVCIERSIDLAIALLGIWKAGGVYMPLDPSYPSERLRWMLAESQARVIVTRSSHLKHFTGATANLLPMEYIPLWQTFHFDALAAEFYPDQAAYVIYTSGSTGKPKGVLVPQQAVLWHAYAAITMYKLQSEDRVLQFASANFDVSLEEMVPSWLAGAAVIMRSEAPVPSLAEFSRLVTEHSLSVLNIPSSYWHEWVAELAHTHTSLSPSLRLVIIGSEKASATRLALWQRLVDERVVVYNAYGLTETTITSLLYKTEPTHAREEQFSLPVGRPLAHVEMYVLDDRLQPVPIGFSGELYIGGLSLARGYMGNPEATAECFLPHPFSTLPGARIYRTKDRARYLPSGNVQLLGRSDSQMKIRGYRIEPGEIEARLLQHAAVQEALVLTREEAPEQVSLVAYLVLREETPFLLRKLRNYLQETLPPYMVPAVFVPLEALPRTSTGKVDLRALPAPQQKLSQTETYVAPITPLEEIIATIWCDIFHLERVGRLDHFFKLGGHSLQATQVVARVREILRLELSVRAVYTAPTIAMLAAYIEQERQQAMGQLLPPLQHISQDTNLPLSFEQQRLWFLAQLQPDDPSYNMPDALLLTGVLNKDALERSLQDLVQRHPVLRTTFKLSQSEPVQVIDAEARFVLPVRELRLSNDPTTREAALLECCREEARQPFDLEHGSLLRATLVRITSDEHVLLLTLHHIIADAWSAEIFFRELRALYTAHVQGQPVTLPPLTVQYTDYALWQRSWFQSHILERHLTYWRQQLAGVTATLDLPTDRPRPAVQTFHGASYAFTIPLALTRQLQALSREEGVTLFMTLLTALQVLLYRYTGQNDIVVGTPASGRLHRETENVMGLFLNMLALRIPVTGNMTYHDLLERVRDTTLDAYMHQDLPFEKLLTDLPVERSLSYAPLFQVVLILQHVRLNVSTLPGLHVEMLATENATAKFDLTYLLNETPNGLQGILEYNTDLFDEATVARMATHYQQLLEALVTQTQQYIWALPLLAETERVQVLTTWQGQQQSYGQEVCLHQLVEAQVLRTPDAIALVYEEDQLSYGELNRRANQLAHHLRRLGVQPETLVGICTERSLDLVIGMLGILKAGGAYAPLDPAYPPERLAFILLNSRASVLLTQQSLLAHFAGYHGQVVCLDAAPNTLADEPMENPRSEVMADNLAYAIHTSGSTGQPKGVLLSHTNIVRLFAATRAWFHFGTDDIWTQFHSAAFDVSVWEIWGALCHGSKLIIVPHWLTRSPEAFYALLRFQQVTVLCQTPQAFDQMGTVATTTTDPQSSALRVVILAGEALVFQKLQAWFAQHGDVLPQIVNMYGITETTVYNTYYPVSAKDTVTATGSVIGVPIPDLQTYILDQYLQPVPIGVLGEIYIGGSCVARGYLQRPDLTAERFLPDPFSQQVGTRLYRTGDQARYLPNGNIEYIGRIDQQIKLRGFRIELGEIEAVLRQHPSVQDVVVSQRRDRLDDPRLVAYIVLTSASTVVTHSEWHTYVQQHLPDYMIPASFVILEQLPLTTNGKVDYKRLPTPDWQERPELAGSFVAPRTELEALLAKIWSEVIGVAQVGVYDNFFELGGDSIKIIQVNARARQENLRIEPRQMFQQQTIAGLAAIIDIVPTTVIEQDVTDEPFPLTPIQHWFFAQQQPQPHHYNQSILLEGRHLDTHVLAQALIRLLQHHDALRLRFQPRQQTYLPSSAVTEAPLSVVDLTDQPLEQQRQSKVDLMTSFQASLNLTQGPLFQAILFDLGVHVPQQLLLIAHHLVMDIVSWGIVLEDLETLYAQISQGAEVRLPLKTTSYQRWATHLLTYAHSSVLQQEAHYWLDHLQKPTATLPRDRRTQGQEPDIEESTRSVVVSLSVSETQALLQEVPKVYHSQVNDALLTALAETLQAWTNGQAVLVDLEGHGREHIVEQIDLSRTVGWFTAIFPLLLDISNIDGPGARLIAIKEQLRAIPHHGIGYGLLRYLGPDQNIVAKLLSIPQAEVSFNYLGQPTQSENPTALLRPLNESNGRAFSTQTRRKHVLDILSHVSGGQLHVEWMYSEQVHLPATIEQLAQNYIQALQRLIAHCLSPEAGGYTPSDFPLARLDSQMLSKIAQMIAEEE